MSPPFSGKHAAPPAELAGAPGNIRDDAVLALCNAHFYASIVTGDIRGAAEAVKEGANPGEDDEHSAVRSRAAVLAACAAGDAIGFLKAVAKRMRACPGETVTAASSARHRVAIPGVRWADGESDDYAPLPNWATLCAQPGATAGVLYAAVWCGWDIYGNRVATHWTAAAAFRVLVHRAYQASPPPNITMEEVQGLYMSTAAYHAVALDARESSNNDIMGVVVYSTALWEIGVLEELASPWLASLIRAFYWNKPHERECALNLLTNHLILFSAEDANRARAGGASPDTMTIMDYHRYELAAVPMSTVFTYRPDALRFACPGAAETPGEPQAHEGRYAWLGVDVMLYEFEEISRKRAGWPSRTHETRRLRAPPFMIVPLCDDATARASTAST